MLCRICRCRFDSSTTSMSTMPIVPTPAAARYIAAGEPSPPAPSISTRVEQLELSFFADLGQQQVALITAALVGRQRARPLPRTAFVLPAVESAVHRHDVGVAQVAQGLRRERRAHAAGAHHDDRTLLITEAAFDLRFEMTARDVHRSGHCALFELVGFADVEQQRAVGDERFGPRGSTSRIWDFACFNRSRNDAIADPPCNTQTTGH